MKHRCTQASYPLPIPNLSLHKYRLENFSDDHLFATGSKNVWAGRVKVKLSSTREAAISLYHFESQWKKSNILTDGIQAAVNWGSSKRQNEFSSESNRHSAAVSFGWIRTLGWNRIDQETGNIRSL